MRQRMLKRQTNEEFLAIRLRKALIVDDDPADLDYHAQLLQGQGHEVLACPSYAIGAELAERGGFDFAVIAQGSAFEGRAVIQRLIAHHPQMPFIVCARSKQMWHYLESMNLGALDYLEKPTHPAEIRRILRGYLASHGPWLSPSEGNRQKWKPSVADTVRGVT